MIPTFSKLDLAFTCLGSAVLPTQEDEPGDAAREGTACHEYLARRVAGLSDANSLSLVPTEWRDAVQSREWESIIEELSGSMIEVACSISGATGKCSIIGLDIDRDYGTRRLVSFCGSLDYVHKHNGIPRVVDLKTGQYAPDVTTTWQLRAAALAVAHMYEASVVDVAIVSVRPGMTPQWQSHRVDALQLAEDSSLLTSLHADIAVASQQWAIDHTPPALHFGSHCRYCPARLACPAYSAKAADIVQRPATTLALPLGTRAQRTTAYHQLRQAEMILADLKKQIVAASAIEPIEVAPGVVYGPRTTQRESLNPHKVADRLDALYGDGTHLDAVEPSATKTSVKRALKFLSVKMDRPLAQLEREFYADLRAHMGVETTQSTKVDEHEGELPPLVGD